MMTLHDRCVAYTQSEFGQKWPASRLQLVQEQGHDVLYGVWVLGNNYRNKTPLYGAYPPGYLDRIEVLFPSMGGRFVLHAFSGSLPANQKRYTRLDLNPDRQPDVVGNVYDVASLFAGQHPFDLVIADPPYSKSDAAEYDTPMVDRRRALAALATVTVAGGHLVWLDQVWPMHAKSEWTTVGRITLIRSTNHRVRLVSIFERRAA